ncbi:hypothetical protein AALP_AA3G283700 [Arabis alpina]|uniref:Uncharacterized protein n=1 Tax=Arabis alpina TaxID=50452 RepID=A0A087HCA6_ARAAL|nr:hypothetical protein AALP_AA3G283700 [Arabis alpina]
MIKFKRGQDCLEDLFHEKNKKRKNKKKRSFRVSIKNKLLYRG